MIPDIPIFQNANMNVVNVGKSLVSLLMRLCPQSDT